ncbi:hypothetical protein AB0G74_08550 [Streptomyces sp. NPDC020875]|uniref:tetratricopeptide repeat protein n=1 Tax=Streptomyces sp. NPDC020875 TaxID=3154898 RepID=UPI0033E4F027
MTIPATNGTPGQGRFDRFDAAYDVLEPTPRRVHRILGTLPLPVLDADITAAACALPWAEADWFCQVLEEEQLIQRSGYFGSDEDRSPLYRVGVAAQEHAATLSHGEEVAALDRLAAWFLVCARSVQRRLAPHQHQPPLPSPGPQLEGPGLDLPFDPFHEPAMLEWLEHQSANLPPLLGAMEERGRPDLIWRTVDAFWPLFQQRRPYPLWADAHRAGLAAARSDGDRAGERRMLLSGALGLLSSGRHGEAADWNTAARDAARAGKDGRDEGQALYQLALLRLAERRVEDATALVAQALTRWESEGYRRGEALAQIVLAQCVTPDKPRRAVDLLSCARKTLRTEPGSDHHRIRARALRGHARLQLGDPAGAVTDLETALTEYPEDDTSPWPARTRDWLARARTTLSANEPPPAAGSAPDAPAAPGGLTERSGR